MKMKMNTMAAVSEDVVSATRRTSYLEDGGVADVEDGLAEPSLPATNVNENKKMRTNSIENMTLLDEKSHNKNKWLIISLIVCVGAAASIAFISLGTAGAKHDNHEDFRRRAAELTFDIGSAADDYELLGLWIHESCHKSFHNTVVPLEEDSAAHLGFCSREDFKNLYDHVVLSGVKAQAIEYVPNITHAARATVEAEAKRYYEKNYPHYDYQGFKRVVPDAEPGERIKEELDNDFYLTLHYVEPVITNEFAIDLSIYSNPARRKAIDNAVATWKPALSDRLKLVQETDPNAFGFGLIHPGVRNFENSTSPPTSFSQVIVRIPALLERASRAALANNSVYIYDTTDTSVEPIFLGAANIRVSNDDGEVNVSSIPETRFSETSSRFTRVIQVADRSWTISVVPTDTSLDLVFIILGGLFIFAASIITSILVYTHLARLTKMNELRSEAEKDKAKVVLERELNEFVAHEVRNPLSSAIAALSFVSTASMEPVQDKESRKALMDDIDVVYSSLQFINDLLRNMLDIHRTTQSEIKLALSPTDVLRDVFEPVASMLFMRGAKVDIVTDCPNNLIVLSDGMRLKQIILNLASNATKFVEQGYIRLRAAVIKGNVTLFVEDSGPGIPTEKRERLFAKFQASLDQLNQGTGIGLCVCKNLSELMGVDIGLDDGFESGVDGCPGTRFTLSLNQSPVELESNDLVHNDASDARPGSHINCASLPRELPDSLSVLFVDDDTVLRKMFVRALRRAAPNWKVDEAASGETSLQLVKSQTFDLIFMDQYMASIDKQLLGTECVRALRASGVTSTICGLSANDKAQEFLDAGADTFMSKPFPCGIEGMRAAILRVLEEGEKRLSKPTTMQVAVSHDSSLEKSVI
jgi:signal transduction histidine kinase/CheY-like chemotaxis protein